MSEEIGLPKPDAPPIGRCRKAMWWGYGAPAGTCDEPAWSGQLPGRYGEWEGGRWIEHHVGGEFACPRHGGRTQEEASALAAAGGKG